MTVETVADIGAQDLEVLRLSARGWSRRRVAQAMEISIRTVDECLSRIRTNLGASTTIHAAAIAVRRGLI